MDRPIPNPRESVKPFNDFWRGDGVSTMGYRRCPPENPECPPENPPEDLDAPPEKPPPEEARGAEKLCRGAAYDRGAE
jgi:hypothetical protein